MRYMKTVFSLSTMLILAGCVSSNLPPPQIERVFVEVQVPVATGCIKKGTRPDTVVPLNERLTLEEWNARTPGAKAATITVQGTDRQNYGTELAAATSACPEVKPTEGE